MAEKMMVTLAESGHRLFRATSPLSRGQLKSKGCGNLSIHYCADQDTITTFFHTIISVNQLSLYGAVSDMCGEDDTCHERTERLVVMKQSSSSLALSVIKTEVPLDCDDPANKDLLLLQQYGERIVKLSHQDKLSNFLMDAGFLSVVEIGQYFMTKDTGDLKWRVVNTLFREKTQHHNRKDGSKETQKLDPCWKLRPVACVVNMEVRSEFGL